MTTSVVMVPVVMAVAVAAVMALPAAPVMVVAVAAVMAAAAAARLAEAAAGMRVTAVSSEDSPHPAWLHTKFVGLRGAANTLYNSRLDVDVEAKKPGVERFCLLNW